MAWNPSPEVQVARDAAAKLGRMAGSQVDQIIVTYITADDRVGYASYGKNKQKCDAAHWLAEKIRSRVLEVFEDYQG